MWALKSSLAGELSWGSERTCGHGVPRPQCPGKPALPHRADHLEEYLVRPRFEDSRKPWPHPLIERAFRAFLECGILRFGAMRFRCPKCGHDLFVAFSCKRRGTCPSCDAKRAAVSVTWALEELLPSVRHRQWVLVVPKRLRYFIHRRADLAGLVSKILTNLIQPPGVQPATRPSHDAEALMTARALALAALASSAAWAHPPLMERDEMIVDSDLIAVVDIVEAAKVGPKGGCREQRAEAVLRELIKGKDPGPRFSLELSCLRPYPAFDLRPGRFIVFLRSNLNHSIPHFSYNWKYAYRPVKGSDVEWFAGADGYAMAQRPLMEVVSEIKALDKKPSKRVRPRARCDYRYMMNSPECCPPGAMCD